jgi:hypothetical protein
MYSNTQALIVCNEIMKSVLLPSNDTCFAFRCATNTLTTRNRRRRGSWHTYLQRFLGGCRQQRGTRGGGWCWYQRSPRSRSVRGYHCRTLQVATCIPIENRAFVVPLVQLTIPEPNKIFEGQSIAILVKCTFLQATSS